VKKIVCLGCGWDSKIIYLTSRDSYQCTHCGHIWERARKLVKEKLYRCPSCGHEWQEKDILIGEKVEAAQ
jgi:putative FmdB family regulatory protein